MANLEWAMWYRDAGLSLVPIRPGEKRPAVRWQAFREQPATPEEIRRWFEAIPEAGIAAILGKASGIVVVDVDGPDAHQAIVQRVGDIPLAPTAISGSGRPSRYHLYFQAPSFPTAAKTTPWNSSLEFRGDGGLIILPPSLHPSGQRYSWAAGRGLWEIPLPPLPQQIAEAMGRRARKAAGTCVRVTHSSLPPIITNARLCGATKRFLRGQYSGGRRWNDKIFNAACDLAAAGYGLDAAMPMLLAGARAYNAEEEDKARRTIESAFSQPRVPGRTLHHDDDSSAVDNVLKTWTTGDLVIHQVGHAKRRYLPMPATIEL
jgi:hypothetical protein